MSPADVARQRDPSIENPYASPAEAALADEIPLGRSRLLTASLVCAALVAAFYGAVLVLIASPYADSPPVNTVFMYGMIGMVLLAVSGLGLGIIEVARRRRGPWLPSIGISVNGAALILPTIAVLRQIPL